MKIGGDVYGWVKIGIVAGGVYLGWKGWQYVTGGHDENNVFYRGANWITQLVTGEEHETLGGQISDIINGNGSHASAPISEKHLYMFYRYQDYYRLFGLRYVPGSGIPLYINGEPYRGTEEGRKRYGFKQ